MWPWVVVRCTSRWAVTTPADGGVLERGCFVFFTEGKEESFLTEFDTLGNRVLQKVTKAPEGSAALESCGGKCHTWQGPPKADLLGVNLRGSLVDPGFYESGMYR